MSFCSNCGKEIVENVKFCSACGTKVTSVDEEIVSSSNGKQEEKVFFKYIGVGKELVISSELIECTYKKLFHTEKISIIPKNIDSFEYADYNGYRKFGQCLAILAPLVMVWSGFFDIVSHVSGNFLFFIGFCMLMIGLPFALLKPQVQISSGVKNYLLPISTFGSKEEILNAIQSAVSYKK